MKVKRYVLMAGHHYYPLQGWNDLVGSYDTLDEAETQAGIATGESGYDPDAAPGKRYYGGNDWYQIIDIETGEMVSDG